MTLVRSALIPLSPMHFWVMMGLQYMSEKLVVPPASISRMTISIPEVKSSSLILSSMGQTV